MLKPRFGVRSWIGICLSQIEVSEYYKMWLLFANSKGTYMHVHHTNKCIVTSCSES